MTIAKNLKKLPWTLDSLKAEKHFIEVIPDWLLVMKDAPVEDGAVSPAQKIYDRLVMKGEKCGLEFPKKHGMSIGERTVIKDTAASQNEAMLNWFEMAEKICTELGKTPQEVSKLLENPFQNIQILRPYMRQIVINSTRLKSTQTEAATVTTILQQRLTEEWTEQDTMALNSILFDRLYDYCENEQHGWIKSEGSEGEIEGDSPLAALPASENELVA